MNLMGNIIDRLHTSAHQVLNDPASSRQVIHPTCRLVLGTVLPKRAFIRLMAVLIGLNPGLGRRRQHDLHLLQTFGYPDLPGCYRLGHILHGKELLQLQAGSTVNVLGVDMHEHGGQHLEADPLEDAGSFRP